VSGSLAVHRSGQGSPSLVLLHGFGASSRCWEPWLPALEPEVTLLRVDLAGFGSSPPAHGLDLSLEAQANRVVSLIRSLGTPPPVLIGHSLGGSIALLAALNLLGDDAAALTGLVLISPAALPQSFPPYMTVARLRGLGELVLAMAPPRYLLGRGLRGIMGSRASSTGLVDRTMVDRYRDPLLSRSRRRELLRAARAIRPETALAVRPRLRELTLPTLVLWGSEDEVVPVALAPELATYLPGAEFHLLPEVGHLLQEEAPEAAEELLIPWLSRLPRAR